MKRFLFFLCASFFVAGCSDDEDILPKQREQIVSYLRNTHSPRLMSVQEAQESLEVQPQYYTETGSTAYRYIKNLYDTERRLRPEVGEGSRISITYRGYRFSFKNPTLADLYITNDAELEGELVKEGLTGGYWEFGVPLVIEVGATPVLGGLDAALPGCREKDTVEVYMTYTMAYGDKLMYAIPKQTPVAWFFTIDKVE